MGVFCVVLWVFCGFCVIINAKKPHVFFISVSCLYTIIFVLKVI